LAKGCGKGSPARADGLAARRAAGLRHDRAAKPKRRGISSPVSSGSSLGRGRDRRQLRLRSLPGCSQCRHDRHCEPNDPNCVSLSSVSAAASTPMRASRLTYNPPSWQDVATGSSRRRCQQRRPGKAGRRRPMVINSARMERSRSPKLVRRHRPGRCRHQSSPRHGSSCLQTLWKSPRPSAGAWQRYVWPTKTPSLCWNSSWVSPRFV
jgi:hypothetical protein